MGAKHSRSRSSARRARDDGGAYGRHGHHEHAHERPKDIPRRSTDRQQGREEQERAEFRRALALSLREEEDAEQYRRAVTMSLQEAEYTQTATAIQASLGHRDYPVELPDDVLSYGDLEVVLGPTGELMVAPRGSGITPEARGR
eukprot:RCo055674